MKIITKQIHHSLIFFIFFMSLFVFYSDIFANKNQQEKEVLIEELDSLANIILHTDKIEIKERAEKNFFQKFPNTFQQFVSLYGYYKDSTKNLAPNIGEKYAIKHIIEIFGNLGYVNDTLYAKKVVNICIDGYWQPDAVSYLKMILRRKITDKKLVGIYFNILSQCPIEKIKNFWKFYFSYTDKSVKLTPFEIMKEQYPNIYKIATDMRATHSLHMR